TLTVSKPDNDSTSTALRCALALNKSPLNLRIRHCEKKDAAKTTTAAIAGGSIKYGDNQPNTAKNKNKKGRSTNVVKLAEAIKSRTASKERKLAAKAPTEEGRLSRRMSSTRSITRADTLISTSLLALSTTRARTTVNIQLKNNASAKPDAITHKVSKASLGTTLSYTFSVKRGIMMANILINKAAPSASRYNRQLANTDAQNQFLRRGSSNPSVARDST